MAKKFQTYEEALTAQEEAKSAVKEAKTALTEYYTKNKLKRNEDYTDDAKHGGKIQRLQQNIDKASETLADINEQVKGLKPGKAKAGRDTKYEYPADCVTAEQRKKYRIKMRKEADSDKPKKEKTEKPAPKKAKAEKATEEAPETKTAKKPVKKAASTKTEEAPKSPVKKVKKKVRKSSDD